MAEVEPRTALLTSLSNLLRIPLVAGYVLIALIRIDYPFKLEWMEGGSLHQVTRILLGQKLYVAPSLDFTPFIYNPLYFYAAALLSKLLGADLFTLRLLSLVASLGCFSVIGLIVWNECGDLLCGILSGSLFAATFSLTGGWFDLARVDSLFLFLFLLGLYVIRRWDSTLATVAAAILIWLSFLTKQTALIMAFGIMAYLLAYHWKRFCWFSATLICLLIVGTLLLDWIHSGWYTYYAFGLPSHFQIEPLGYYFLFHFWTNDLLAPLGIACATSLFFLISGLARGNKRDTTFYLLIVASMLAASWLSRVKVSGYHNVLFPAYAGICVLFGLGVHRALTLVEGVPDRRKAIATSVIWVACIVQFATLAYSPLKQLPGKDDLQAGRSLVKMIAGYGGDVFIPNHPYLAVMAGKDWHALSICMTDVPRGDQGEAAEKLKTEMSRALRDRKFDAVILDDDLLFVRDVAKYYKPRIRLFPGKDVFWPVTGQMARPAIVCEPVRPGESKKDREGATGP
jgi:hypothetical protein